MTDRIGDWIVTFTGKKFYPLDPRPEEICIEDIAHALSNLCRYGGHCIDFYSVAQHSVIVSKIVSPIHAEWGLLHDAAEAYLVDLPRPIKNYSELGRLYKIAEINLLESIKIAFNLEGDEPPEVKMYDTIALVTEKRSMISNQELTWKSDMENVKPLDYNIIPVSSKRAEIMFLERYKEIWK